MSDNNKSQSRANYFLIGFLFALFGLFFHSVFFIGTLICLIINLPSRNQKIMMSAFGAFFVIVSFGYSIGKDMAIRDNNAASLSQDKTP